MSPPGCPSVQEKAFVEAKRISFIPLPQSNDRPLRAHTHLLPIFHVCVLPHTPPVRKGLSFLLPRVAPGQTLLSSSFPTEKPNLCKPPFPPASSAPPVRPSKMRIKGLSPSHRRSYAVPYTHTLIPYSRHNVISSLCSHCSNFFSHTLVAMPFSGWKCMNGVYALSLSVGALGAL